MKRSMFVASAIMTLVLVFTACGGAAVATPRPTRDIPITKVIAMAVAHEIRQIQVDGKKLTVYPKTTASGGAVRFVSKIGGDTDFIGLLIDSGVDVGPPSGIVVTIKGVSAEDVKAAISAALAISIVEDVRVTPTPGPALTPTPTATPAPTVKSEPIPTLIPTFTPATTLTSAPTLGPTPTATPTPTPSANLTPIPIPQRPLIHLRHDGQIYKGVAGNSCWPMETGVSLCGVEGPHPWEVVDTATGESCPSGASWCGTAVPVPTGDSIIVEIDADDQPKVLQAAIYDNASKAHSDPPAQVITLETGFPSPFAVDVPAGTYYIRISGQWDDGEVAFKFKMVVSS